MSATAQAMADFLAILDGRGDERYARPPQHEVLEISGVVLDSSGGVDHYTATIDGKGEFSVRAGGTSLAPRDRVLGLRIGQDPFGADYQYVEVVASTNPFAGILAVDANIPYPVLTGFLTQLNGSGGAITASGTVTWNQVEEKYGPSGYKVSWRVTGTANWQDIYVPHRTGLSGGQVLLSVALMPGSQVDVKIATQANWVLRTSPDSPTSTYNVQADTQNPATLSGITVTTGTPGQLVFQLVYSSLDPVFFDHWELTIATSPTGAGAVTYNTVADTFVWGGGSAGVGYYVTARARAKNGTFGNRIPVTPGTYQGPYSYAAATPPPDSTPPPAFASAPTLADASYIDDAYGTHGVVVVTLPGGYAFPGDYMGTEVLCNSSEGRTDIRWIDGTTTSKSFEIGFSALWTISIRGVDTHGLRQTGWSPAATISLPIPGIPATAGTPTIVQKALSLQVSWLMPTRSVWIELSRANDAGFTTGVTVIGNFQGTSYLDLEDALNSVPPYPARFYRIRGLNAQGFGPYGPVSASATVQKLDGRNLVADTITAVEIAAGTITGTEINASIVLASLVRSATTTSGAGPTVRFALEGGTGGVNQGTLKFFEWVTSSEKTRMNLSGAGMELYYDSGIRAMGLYKQGLYWTRDVSGSPVRLAIEPNQMTFYSDGGVAEFVLGISAAHAYLQMFGIRIEPGQINLDTSSAYTMRMYDTVDASTEFRFKSNAPGLTGQTTLGLIGDLSAADPSRAFIIGRGPSFGVGSSYQYVAFDRASITFATNGVTARTLSLVNATIGSYASYIRNSGGFRTGDILVDRLNSTGVIYFGDQSPGARYIFYDGTRYQMLSGGVSVVGGSLQIQTTINDAALNIYNGDVATVAGGGSPYLVHQWAGSTNELDLYEFFYRFQGTSGWPGTVHVQQYRVDVSGFTGGTLMLGSNSAGFEYWSLGYSATAHIFWSHTNNWIDVATAMRVQGFLTKTGGGFRIPHPDPAKPDRDLVHSFVETPTRGDNIYRLPFRATPRDRLQQGGQVYEVVVPLPDYFRFLNEEPDCLVQARDSFGVGYARARADLTALVVRVTVPGEYVIVALATRKDPDILRLWAEQGDTIEPLRSVDDQPDFASAERIVA